MAAMKEIRNIVILTGARHDSGKLGTVRRMK